MAETPDNVIPFPVHREPARLVRLLNRGRWGDAVSLELDGHGGNMLASLLEGLQRAIAMLPPGRVRISVTVESLEPPDGERKVL